MGRISPEVKTARRIRRRLKAVSGIVATIMVIAVTLIVSLYAAGVRTSYTVSGSMEPTIYRGDLILSSTRYNAIDKGDIIVYQAHWFHDKPVLHRVKDKALDKDTGEFRGYIMRGDNNDADDPETVTPSQVTSEVMAVIPYAGWVINPWTLAGAATLVITLTLATLINWEQVAAHRRKAL
jgi:signal peptidase I